MVWLELKAKNQKAVTDLTKKLISTKSNDLKNPYMSLDNMREYLKNQRIRALIHNLRLANQGLEVKKEKIPDNWLSPLSKKEKKIFKEIYENGRNYSEIAKEFNCSTNEINEYFNNSIKKVIKILQKEDES